MYNSNEVARKIKSVAKTKNVTVSEILRTAGLGINTLSNMRVSMPKADNLAKIADCLGCSVDYLLDRDNYSNIEGNGNVVQQGQIHNSPVTIGGISSRCLTEQEQEILRIFNNLSVKEKAELFLKICDYEKNKQI